MIKILIVDDHPLVRQGIVKLLEDEDNFEIVAQANTVNEMFQLLKSNHIDIILLDIALPETTGFEALETLIYRYPKINVIMLSALSEEAYAIQSVKAGAKGFVSKESVNDELIFAIKMVSSGEVYFSNELTKKIAMQVINPNDKEPHKRLTNREFQVLCAIGAGETITQIAQNLNLSAKTVSTYKNRLMEKMHMNTTGALIKYCINKGLTNSDLIKE